MQTGWLTIFASTAFARNVPLPVRDVAFYKYSGCYHDSVDKRTLNYPSNRDYDIQTVETCTSWCAANKFSYCGLEYGSECYGDYSLRVNITAPESDCSMPCAGNSSQLCGNGNRLGVYTSGVADSAPSTNLSPEGWEFVACYTDSADSRTLSTPQGVDSGSSGMTVAKCTAACGAEGYRYAGLEYADECYCDNTVRNPGSIANSGCDMTCSGNSSEFCGGSNRLTLYQSSIYSPPVSGDTPVGWTDIGCYTDNGGARTLGTQQETPGGYMNMTIEGCLGVCNSRGYAYSGLEYGQECYCGNSILNGGSCAADQKSCYMPCKGNTAETCGGSNRLNVFFAGSGSSVSSCAEQSNSSSTSGAGTPETVSSTTSSNGDSGSSTETSETPSPSSTPSSSAIDSSTSVSSSTSTTLTFPSTTAASTTTSSTFTTSSISSTLSCPTATSTVCPSFWSSIISDLAPSMRDASGQCTDTARAAIRFAFHDAATFSSKLPFYAPAAGGADGSLLLSANEISRTDNNGLGDFHAFLTRKFAAYKAAGFCVGAADLIQVSGSLAVLACPGGRIGRVYVGRTDSSAEAPDGLLPQAFGPASSHDTILQLFQDKGISARDLAALLGAHSTSKANFQTANSMPAGVSQDDTPGLWDIKYYNQTYFPVEGMARFDSDVHLSNESTTVGKQFKSFVGNQAAWGASFSSAWQALSILGIPRAARAGFVDCTTAVVAAYPS